MGERNGMDGGFIFGRDDVREYRRAQFELIRSQLEPLKFERDDNNRSVVTVHHIVRDRRGELLTEMTNRHLFTVENDLVVLFEISDSEPLNKLKNPISTSRKE